MASRLLSRALSTPMSAMSTANGTVSSAHRCISSGILSVHQREGVRRLVLNNEPKRNALSYSMLESLATALLPSDDPHRDDALSCVVISAKGNVFSAGHDLNELRQPTTSPSPKELFDLCSYVMQSIKSYPVPVIAQVSGLATAAGCQLVASCDIVIAGESAKFATPGVNIGLFCSTPSVPLLRCIPQKKASYMLFTGEPITAQEALVHGLVSKVVPDDELESAVDAVTDHLSSLSKDVLVHGKLALEAINYESTLEGAYRKASDFMTKNAVMDDCQEGIHAFFEKRRPDWNK